MDCEPDLSFRERRWKDRDKRAVDRGSIASQSDKQPRQTETLSWQPEEEEDTLDTPLLLAVSVKRDRPAKV